MNYSQTAISNFKNGNNFYKIERYQEALEKFEKAVDEDLSFYEAHFSIAKTNSRLKNYPKAIEAFKIAMKFVPEDSRSQFVFGFMNILQQDGFIKQAIALYESINFKLDTAANKKYLTLLLQNNETSKFLKLCFTLLPLQSRESSVKEILTNSFIPVETKNFITKQNIFAKLKYLSTKINVLKQQKFKDSKTRKQIVEAAADYQAIQNGNAENINSNLEALKQKISSILQTIYIASTSYKNDAKELEKIKTFLAQNQFEKSKIEALNKQILSLKEKNKKEIVKKTLIVLGVLLIIASAIFGYLYFTNKKEAKIFALKSKNIETINNYIEKYGTNKEIDKAREKLMYYTSVNSSASESINDFIKAYPNSKYLRTITIINNTSQKYSVFGKKTRFKDINPVSKDTYLLPYDAKVGFGSTQESNPLAIRYFSVSKNINITYTDSNTQINNLAHSSLVYVNASKLNVRTAGYGFADVVEQIQRAEPVVYLGEHSEEKTKAVFFGEKVEDYYYKIQTKNNYGWVHGAGINFIQTNYTLNLRDFLLTLKNVEKKYKDTTGIIKPNIKNEPAEELLIENVEEIQEIEDSIIETTPESETIKQAEEVKEPKEKAVKPKAVKTICTRCSGKGKNKRNCTDSKCNFGTLTTDCTTCNGNYRSGTDLCKNPGCNYEGCEYCDYDAAACNKCTRGKTNLKHKNCNGTGKISTQCSKCSGTGYIMK